MVELSPLRQLRMGQLPKMVSWYDPRLLARIGVRTIVSSVFGQYADQRLMQAVTDPAEDKDLVARYDYRDPNAGEPHKCVACDETGAFWIDYIADVGDGFECHLHDGLPDGAGQPRYPRRRQPAPRRGPHHGRRPVLSAGHARGIQGAAAAALQLGLSRSPKPDRKLFAIPGNHDWYDGLNAFDGLFCSSRDKLSNDARQRHRRLAVPAASQLLGAAPALQLVDLGRRHPVLEVSGQLPGQLLRCAWPSRWARRTI